MDSLSPNGPFSHHQSFPPCQGPGSVIFFDLLSKSAPGTTHFRNRYGEVCMPLYHWKVLSRMESRFSLAGTL